MLCCSFADLIGIEKKQQILILQYKIGLFKICVRYDIIHSSIICICYFLRTSCHSCFIFRLHSADMFFFLAFIQSDNENKRQSKESLLQKSYLFRFVLRHCAFVCEFIIFYILRSFRKFSLHYSIYQRV